MFNIYISLHIMFAIIVDPCLTITYFTLKGGPLFCLLIVILTIALRSQNGGKSKEECTLCDDGKFCNNTGLTKVTGDCAPGYYCLRGSSQYKPNNGTHGGPCPKGNFCEEGSSSPDNPCKEGKTTCFNVSISSWCTLLTRFRFTSTTVTIKRT